MYIQMICTYICHSIELIELHPLRQVSTVSHLRERIVEGNIIPKPNVCFYKDLPRKPLMYFEVIYMPFDRARCAESNGVSFISGSRYRANRHGKNFFDGFFNGENRKFLLLFLLVRF